MTAAAFWQGANGRPGIGCGLGLLAKLKVEGDHLNMQGLLLRGSFEGLEQAGSSLIHPAKGSERLRELTRRKWVSRMFFEKSLKMRQSLFMAIKMDVSQGQRGEYGGWSSLLHSRQSQGGLQSKTPLLGDGCLQHEVEVNLLTARMLLGLFPGQVEVIAGLLNLPDRIDLSEVVDYRIEVADGKPTFGEVRRQQFMDASDEGQTWKPSTEAQAKEIPIEGEGSTLAVVASVGRDRLSQEDGMTLKHVVSEGEVIGL